MESSRCVGLMVVVTVSAAAAVFALEVHKRLASYFIRKLESEIGRQASNRGKKKVTFAPDVVEPSSDSKEYRRRWRSRRLPDSS